MYVMQAMFISISIAASMYVLFFVSPVFSGIVVTVGIVASVPKVVVVRSMIVVGVVSIEMVDSVKSSFRLAYSFSFEVTSICAVYFPSARFNGLRSISRFLVE